MSLLYSDACEPLQAQAIMACEADILTEPAASVLPCIGPSENGFYRPTG